MTRQSSRPKQRLVILKMALVTGSLIATLAGARLLEQQEPLEAAAAVSVNQSALVLTPANEPAVMQLPPSNRRTQVQLQPIPQVVQPRVNPVTRTRSSR
ncbi:MAG: hypothetical protein ACK2U0_14770 [Candidatus Promineifilaceae bacterium]|jgi:hypothetical protein